MFFLSDFCHLANCFEVRPYCSMDQYLASSSAVIFQCMYILHFLSLYKLQVPGFFWGWWFAGSFELFCYTCLHIFVFTYIFISLGQIPSNGIAGLHDKLMLTFLRKCDCFLNGCIISHSYQQGMRPSGFQFHCILDNFGFV